MKVLVARASQIHKGVVWESLWEADEDVMREFRSMITRQQFEGFFEQFKKEKIMEGNVEMVKPIVSKQCLKEGWGGCSYKADEHSIDYSFSSRFRK